MVVFPPVTVRQPRPHDIVDDPIGVCGIGTGFEGVTTIDLPGRPPTARGTLEVFEEAKTGADAS
jgi:hypothetical protein